MSVTNSTVAGLRSDSAAPAPSKAARADALRTDRVWWTGLLGGLLWAGTAGLTAYWPDADDLDGTQGTAAGMLALAVVLVAATVWRAASGRRIGTFHRAGPWLLALALVFASWELVTAKLNLLPRPFFVAPQSLLAVFTDDWRRLGESVLRSLLLLAPGYGIGAIIGFVVGVAIGW